MSGLPSKFGDNQKLVRDLSEHRFQLMEPRADDSDLVTDPAVRSFIGQPSTPSALSLSVRTNSDLIHCSSTATIGRTSTSFQSDKHALKLLDAFNRFRKDGHLCDVKIKVGNRTFSAHKVTPVNPGR